MAYLKKSKNRVGKCYYSSQIKSVNWSKPLTIALKTSDYEVALERHEEVEDNEKAIKRGIKYSFSWEDMSNRGRARIVKKNVEQLVDQWLRIKSTNVRVETHKRYKISMHSFLNVIGYSSPLSILNNQCIEKYKEFYKGTNANGGINTNLRGIKCFLLWAYDEGFIKVMPKIKMMPTEKRKPKYIKDLIPKKNTEFDKKCFPVIGLIHEWNRNGKVFKGTEKNLGGTMRLGLYTAKLQNNSAIKKIYKSNIIKERHRHRYEVNNNQRSKFEKKGLIFSGMSPDNKLPEIIELKNHPWFIGVQFHPEFKSRPLSPHPLFKSFIKAAKNYHGK